MTIGGPGDERHARQVDGAGGPGRAGRDRPTGPAARRAVRAVRQSRQRGEHSGFPVGGRHHRRVPAVLLGRPPWNGLQVAAEHRDVRTGTGTRRRVPRRRPRARCRRVHQEHDRGDQQARPGVAGRDRFGGADDAARTPLERPAVARALPHGARRRLSGRHAGSRRSRSSPRRARRSHRPARRVRRVERHRSGAARARVGGEGPCRRRPHPRRRRPTRPAPRRSTCGPTTIPATSTSSPSRPTRCTPRTALESLVGPRCAFGPTPDHDRRRHGERRHDRYRRLGRPPRPGGGWQPERARCDRPGRGHPHPHRDRARPHRRPRDRTDSVRNRTPGRGARASGSTDRPTPPARPPSSASSRSPSTGSTTG